MNASLYRSAQPSREGFALLGEHASLANGHRPIHTVVSLRVSNHDAPRRHGSDRTGTMVATYRVAVEGWTKDQATDEMVDGGLGFHPLWQNLLRYIDDLDVDALRAEVARQGPWQ